MQRLVLVSLAAVAALAAAPPVAAAQGPSPAPGPLKIAYINSREILQRTPGYAVAESTYLKEVDGYRTEIQKLQQQLDSAVTAFDQQSIALSPAARAAKQKELQAPIQARVNSIIQGLRAELNYALILDADAAGGLIAAADPALNITARVLQRLSQAQ